MPCVAPEKGVSLHWCKDTHCSASKCCRNLVNTAIDKFRNSKICEQGMQHLFIDVRGPNSYSRIKRAQVFDVPCVGDDPPFLVLDLVCARSEHFVDDEQPLPRWL
jgi:hypothetical protein